MASKSKPKSPSKVKKKTDRNVVSSTLATTMPLGLSYANKAIYDQVDKLEFYLSGASIEVSEHPTKSHMVCLPVLTGDLLRFVKVKSCKVYVWNRGPNDIYLEVMQPFGAHTDSSAIVAWGPVRAKKNRPQSRWTLKANKAGGMFRLDMSDNNFTLPATMMVEESKDVKRFCLALFCFAATENAVSFTGTTTTASTRSLQFRIVFEYWGPENTATKAALVKGKYADMGQVVKYPVKTADSVFRELGLMPVSKVIGVHHVQSTDVPYTFQGKTVYVDGSSGPYTQPDKQKLFAFSVGKKISDRLTEIARIINIFEVPCSPTQGLMLKTDDDNLIEDLLLAGFANVVVPWDALPYFQRPDPGTNGQYKSHWFLASRYINASGTINYALLLHGDTSSEHDVMNNYAGPQAAHSPRLVNFFCMMPFDDRLVGGMTDLRGVFNPSTSIRPMFKQQASLGSAQVVAFDAATWITVITVILRVVEAASVAWEKYTVSAYDVLPRHTIYEEKGDDVI